MPLKGAKLQSIDFSVVLKSFCTANSATANQAPVGVAGLVFLS